MLRQPFEHEFSAKLSLEILTPKFFELRREEQAIIVRRLLDYEYNGTVSDADFFRKETLGALLYEYMLYRYEATEVNEYVTQNISQETAKRIFDMYGKRRSDDPLFKPEPRYTIDYFSSPFYLNFCGPLDTKQSPTKAAPTHENTDLDANFMDRIRNLFVAKNVVKQIFGNVLAKQQFLNRSRGKELEDTKKMGISEKQYLDFDISNFGTSIIWKKPEDMISEALESQIRVLHNYLLACWGNADRSTDVMGVIRELQKVLHLIVTCSPEQEENLQKLIEWEFLRLCIVHDVEKADKSKLAKSENQVLESFVTSLRPYRLKDIQIPPQDADEKLLPAVVKRHLNWVTTGILGRTLPKAVIQLYYNAQLCPTPKQFYENQEKFIQKQLDKIFEDLRLNPQSEGLQNSLSHWEMALVALRAEMIHPSLGTVIVKKNDIFSQNALVMLKMSTSFSTATPRSTQPQDKKEAKSLAASLSLAVQVEQKVRSGVEIRDNIRKLKEILPIDAAQAEEIGQEIQKLKKDLASHLQEEAELREKIFPKNPRELPSGDVIGEGSEMLPASQNRTGFLPSQSSPAKLPGVGGAAAGKGLKK